MLGHLLAATRTIRVFPDVANLPLRPPALLAETAAALDVVSGGRFELALGAGGYWDAITRLGVPRRTSAEVNAAPREAIAVLRALWAADGEPVDLAGEYYPLAGAPAGPAPAHPIEIWTGAQGPKALGLTGEIADGWAAPIAAYLPYEKWADANRLIDEAAVTAGRDPASVRRIAQVVGTITTERGRQCLDTGAAPVSRHGGGVGGPAGAAGHRAAVHLVRVLARTGDDRPDGCVRRRGGPKGNRAKECPRRFPDVRTRQGWLSQYLYRQDLPEVQGACQSRRDGTCLHDRRNENQWRTPSSPATQIFST